MLQWSRAAWMAARHSRCCFLFNFFLNYHYDYISFYRLIWFTLFTFLFRYSFFLKHLSQTTMDRVKSSMQQVPNAIPKVIRRTGGANSLELERENFERGQVGRQLGSCYTINTITQQCAAGGSGINSDIGWLLSAHNPKPHWYSTEVAHSVYLFVYLFIFGIFSPSLSPCFFVLDSDCFLSHMSVCVWQIQVSLYSATIELLKCGSMAFWVQITVLLSLSAAQTRKDSDKLKLHGAV